jgi:anti-sigma-K factor RskA
MSDRIDSTGTSPNGEDHRERWDGELAAYALDALDPGERRTVEEHLAACESCSERLHWMQPAVDVLPATVAPQQPPPGLKARIMDVVDSEAALVAAAEGDRSPPAEARPRRRFLAGLSLRPVLAGLAVVLLLAVAVTGYSLSNDDDGGSSAPAITYVAKAGNPSSPADGRLEVMGDAGMLHVANLPPTHDGEVYQAWIQDKGSAGGSVHASSVFVVSEDGVGDVAIPHGLSKAARVMVTREPKGGSVHPSENSLLTAEMG